MELNVPIHPLSFLSVPVSHVTNRGLKQKQSQYIKKPHLFRNKAPTKKNKQRGKPTVTKYNKQYVYIILQWGMISIENINCCKNHRCTNVTQCTQCFPLIQYCVR